MESSIQLASAGDNIKLWDCNGYNLIKEFNPHSDNVHSVAWSHDNSALASASTVGDKIVVSFVGANDYSITLSDKEAQGRTCVAFCSSSRYIVGGGADSIIYLWDMKTQKFKKEFKGLKGSVTTLQFNYNDTVIASGSESGEIMLYNVVTGIGYTPLTTPKSQTIRQLQYNCLKKSLLGSVSDDGCTYLWDTNSKRLLHSFSCVHKAPATGLVFSPLNDMLLLSAGLDKAIVCYDVRSKHIVKTILSESALTSIDFLHDGKTVAVGSSRGKVYIYDLRHSNDPVFVKSAHKTSVACLRFQKSLFISEAGDPGRQSVPSSQTASKSSNSSSINALLRLNTSSGSQVSLSPTAASPQNQTTQVSTEQYSHVGSKATELVDVFSPLRDVHISSATNASSVVPVESDIVQVPTSFNTAISPPVNGMYSVLNLASENENLYSGNANVGSDSFSGLSAVVKSGSNLFSPLNVVSPLNRIESNALNKSSTDAVERFPYLPQNSPLPYADVQEEHVVGHASVPVVTPPDAAPSFEEDLVASASATSSEEVPFESIASVTNAASNTFQLEFIINAFKELLDDSQEQMRRDVLNLHVEMLKQFQIHKMECKKMFDAYSVIPELLAEIQRLREENAQLKKNY